MNAKKIMGAVLVALLAAALFVGAGAAAINAGTVFVNQALPDEPIDLDGDQTPDTSFSQLGWTDSTGVAVTLPTDPMNNAVVYFPKAGVYTADLGEGAISITVVSPVATISGMAGSAAKYPIIPETFFIGTEAQVSIAPVGGNEIAKIYFTLPNGDQEIYNNVGDAKTGIEGILNNNNEKPAVGEYSITVVYASSVFVNTTYVDQMVTKPVVFNVAKSGDVTISASVDQALKTEPFTITITGQPGLQYNVTYDAGDFELVNVNQIGLFETSADNVAAANGVAGFYFTMPNTGKVDVVVKTTKDAEDSEKITVKQSTDSKNKASVTVKLLKGTISAKTEAAAYFIGDEVKITGISTAGKIKNLTIEGANFKDVVEQNELTIKYGSNLEMTFEFELDTGALANELAAGKKIDVGTYTVTILTDNGAKTTVTITLNQPFISIVEVPEVIVKGTEVKFIINAEAVKVSGAANPYINYYFFGNNFFQSGTLVQDDDEETHYVLKLDEDGTKALPEGEFFAVFQHPMNNEIFDIYADTENDAWNIMKGDNVVINVKERQTANAAQALCDELDKQNIDDMYVKAVFFVIGEDESFEISDIPKEVAQGTTLTISGVDTANAGQTVTVQMLSAAFTAIPKEEENVAAFIAVTAEVAEDGTWEVTLDTSKLALDDYNLAVKIADKTQKNVVVKVVAAADEPETPVTPEQPEQPEQPDEPVAPATPGFGALAALAGLGAVAVLLLRRE